MTSSPESYDPSINEFDGRSSSLPATLRFFDLDEWIIKKPNEQNKKEVRTDKKAVGFILENFDPQLINMLNQPTNSVMLKKSLTTYEYAQQLNLKREEFFMAKKKINETMIDFIIRITRLKNELELADYKVSDQNFILTLIGGTHDEFSQFVSSVTGKKSINEINLKDLIRKLIYEDNFRRVCERQFNEKNDKSNIEQPKANSETRHNTSEKRVLFVNKKIKFKHYRNIKKKRKCYHCGIYGHYANECRKLKKAAVPVVRRGIKHRAYMINANSSCSNNINDKDDDLFDCGSLTHV